MDAPSLLLELERRGVELRAAGDRLQVRPAEAVPPALMAELRAHRPALLRQLAGVPAVADGLGGVKEARASLLAAEVCAMRLDDFAHAGLVAEVWSEILREEIVFASDNALLDPGEERPVYRSHELWVLFGLTDPRELRRIHEVKRTFRGTITDASPAYRWGP
jgi:hypothetical protein